MLPTSKKSNKKKGQNCKFDKWCWEFTPTNPKQHIPRSCGVDILSEKNSVVVLPWNCGSQLQGGYIEIKIAERANFMPL